MDCLLQKRSTLEEYVEEFLELYHEAQQDDMAFNYFFWSRMGNILLLEEGHHPLIYFIN